MSNLQSSSLQSYSFLQPPKKNNILQLKAEGHTQKDKNYRTQSSAQITTEHLAFKVKNTKLTHSKAPPKKGLQVNSVGKLSKNSKKSFQPPPEKKKSQPANKANKNNNKKPSYKPSGASSHIFCLCAFPPCGFARADAWAKHPREKRFAVSAVLVWCLLAFFFVFFFFFFGGGGGFCLVCFCMFSLLLILSFCFSWSFCLCWLMLFVNRLAMVLVHGHV